MSQLQTLRDELDAGHPDTGAYSMRDDMASAEINVVNRQRNISAMTSSQVLNAVDVAELAALSTTDQTEFWNLLALGSIDPFGVEVTIIIGIFGGGSTTVSTLSILRKTSVSRAQELGLSNVRPGTIAQARAL